MTELLEDVQSSRGALLEDGAAVGIGSAGRDCAGARAAPSPQQGHPARCAQGWGNRGPSPTGCGVCCISALCRG